jgi:PAS domain S-box-containing protein
MNKREKEYVEEIVEAIMNVARGDYSVQVKPSHRNDSLDSLAIGLNMMIDDISVNFVDIERERAYTENIISSMTDSLLILNPDATIKRTNKATERLLACKEDELVGESISKVFKEEISLFEDVMMADLKANGPIIDMDMTYVSRENEEIPVSFSAAIMRGHEGRTGDMVCVARDLRQIKELIKTNKEKVRELESANEELQETQEASLNIMEDLDRRGRELSELNKQYQNEIDERKKTEAKLQNTLEELEGKNKELDDYTYIISHDLKAPLVTIQGFANLLKKKYGNDLDEKALHYVDTIISGSEDLSSLVTDLLALSKAGRVERKLVNVNLQELFRSSLGSLQAMVEENGVDVSMPEKLPEVIYDSTLLKQVLTNLLANAMKYSRPKVKPRIEIGWKEGPDENVLWIKDNGVGIEEKFLDKIFQPFERIARDKTGTGIGLSIVKKIIERHGGRIWVESKIGKGSKFNFTIPKEGK